MDTDGQLPTEFGDAKMTIRTVFLHWKRAAIPAAIEYLEQRYLRGSTWNLRDVVVVVPGGRAGRRLRELLVAANEQSDRVFFPPQITTVGALPELLYQRKRPFASVLVQKLAWTLALRGAEDDCLAQFLTDRPSAADDPRWYELGTLIWHQHRELASDGLNFHDVASQPDFAESKRWRAMAQVQSEYLSILDRAHLWDRQTARLHAIDHRECATAKDLLLLGTVDMSRALRMMIDQVRDRVTLLIHADSACADRFDSYGCLIPEAWQELEISLDERLILQVDSPADQARAVVHHLYELQAGFAADEITVGVPDERLVPLVQQHLTQAGITSRWGPGRSIEASRPMRLLRVIVDYLQRRSYAQLTELVRHPDVERWLSREHGMGPATLSDLDECQVRHLPSDPLGPWPEDRWSQTARQLTRHVEIWLRELVGEPRSPAAWITPMLELVSQVYGPQRFDLQDDGDRMVLDGCQAVRDALLQLEQVPESFAAVSAAEALLIALDSIESKQVPASATERAVELLGWLELPLDDAPALVVTGLNEGIVPTSANSDLFLPDSIRARLGLGDNARRYARDAYALTVLTHSRTVLRMVLGRRNWQGDPLPPSRLLFAADLDTVARRSQRFFGDDSDNPLLIQADPDPANATHHQFFVPRPRAIPQVSSLSVTDFRSYLACPYRFYLERILRLRRSADDAVELDGAAFGAVAHDVLERFGGGPLKDSSAADQIEEELFRLLALVVEERFPQQPPAAVRVQMAQMQQRLAEFAVRQAAWRRQGWQIQQTEQNVRSRWGSADWQIELRGRIDRVDRHEESGEWAILDYKSSDHAHSPRAMHLGRRAAASAPEDWTDLQLPLYRHLAEEAGCCPPIRLGYVLLPKDRKQAGFKLADWSPEELELADQAARNVIQAIRAAVFWPPKDPPPMFSGGLASICQDLVFDRQLDPEHAI